MKYINIYESIDEAIKAQGNLSPNMSLIKGCSNPNQLVYTNIGDGVKIIFTNNGGFVEGHIGSYLTFTAVQANSMIQLQKSGNFTGITLECSSDGKTWSTFISPSESYATKTLTNVGDKLYFRGSNPNGISQSTSNYYRFCLSGKFAVSGNIMSIIDSINDIFEIPCEYCFYNMFSNNSALVSAPVLPATTLTNSCYRNMFNGCPNLIEAPVLPAETLKEYCYQYMFQDCSSLNYIECAATDISAVNCTNGWVNGVNGDGIFKVPEEMREEWNKKLSGSGKPTNFRYDDYYYYYSGMFVDISIEYLLDMLGDDYELY